MKKRPTALGVYIFAGGFSVGVRKHFEVLAHLEDGPFGAETSRRNLGVEVHTDKGSWPVERFARRTDFVYANPPCAPWSSCSAGRQMPWRLDPRVDCMYRTFALLGQLSPKVMAIESVRPFFTKGRELCDALAKDAMRQGYSATVLFVEASRHRVAQMRPRMFLVFHRVELRLEPPGTPPVTVDQAIRGLPKRSTAIRLRSQYDVLIRNTRPGERSACVFDRMYPRRVSKAAAAGEKVAGRPSFQLQRLRGDGFSSVLTGDCRKIHPREHRLLTVEEAAAVSSFPRGYEFVGSVGQATQQIAKGVMPNVGEYLASQVSSAVAANRRVKKPEYSFAEVFSDRLETKPLEAARAA